MCFIIDWANLIAGRKFTVFALFYFVFEGNLQVQAPLGGLYLEGRFNGGVFALRDWGAYIWRGLYTNFALFLLSPSEKKTSKTSHKCSGPLRPFQTLTDILEGFINLPRFIL